ncbi:MAG: Mrp/NBP35 family ATP-binding protein [Jhaorihella sp.]
MTTREDILADLRNVADPAGGNIVDNGLLKAVTIDGGVVRFVLEIDPKQAETMQPVCDEAEARVRALPGVDKAVGMLTAHSAKAPPDLKPKPRPSETGPQKLPGIKHIIAVASGKGGVGKSTVTANLACALAAQGRRVGLLDADVYGPSQPRMMGVSGRPASPDGKTIVPLANHGVTVMSMGLMTDDDQAVIWRGPMLMGALQQMMTLVHWGELDVLMIDLPPGTGDVQLTLAQKFVVDGAVIVSTPQDVALIDARKAIDMFRRMNTPILGMIENMSTHVCSNCGHEEHVFGHGGVVAEARKLDVPLLAEVPLHLDIRTAGDSGAPVVVSQPDSPQAAAFIKVARELVRQGVA